jgi:predicted transposase YbfD/YdcC
MSQSFIEHFSIIEDPRIERCKKHQLMDILFLSLCAVLSGAEGWEDIEDFGTAKLDWLRKYLPFEHGIPKHDTIARVLSRLNPARIQQCFINWVKDIAADEDMQLIAIDGKTARRSFSTKTRHDALHMVSAWSCGHGLVLGQQKVDEKSNEISAIPKLLEFLDIRGCTLTIDAMGCQHDIARRIVEQGGEYVLALKGNQRQLSEDVRSWFHRAERDNLTQVKHCEFTQTDSGHGRIEIRRCLQLELDANWLTDADKWPSLRTVVRVEAERHIGDKCTTECRYYISSRELDAEHLSGIIRNHWAVENSLHWTLDMTFREDESRIRRGNGAEVMNALRKLALNVIKTNASRTASVKRKLKMAALDDNFRAELLLGVN